MIPQEIETAGVAQETVYNAALMALAKLQGDPTGQTGACLEFFSTVDGLLAVVATGILWADDGQICDLHITKAYDKQNPRVEMTVS